MKFRPYIRRVMYQLLESGGRKPFRLDFLTAITGALQDLHAIDFYSDNVTYYPGDRVSFKFRTYEAPDNTATSGGFSGKQPIIDNQVHTDGSGHPYWFEVERRTLDQIRAESLFRQTWNGQVIYLEHYLNAVLNNNSPDPYANNAYIATGKDIYIEDVSERDYVWMFRGSTWPVLSLDAFYMFRAWDSTVNYDQGDRIAHPYGNGGERVYRATEANTDYTGKDPINYPDLWAFEREVEYMYRKDYYLIDPHFIIWVPTEVANTLANWKDVVRKHADRYVFAGRKYEVKSY